MQKLGVLVVLVLVSCSSPAKPPPSPPSPPMSGPPAELPAPTAAAAEDPHLWLEEVSSEEALAWARARNGESRGELEAVPGFAAIRDRIRGILDSKDKTPYVTKQGSLYYNFWTDEKNPKGLIRRTTLAEYRKPSPRWELVLDIDALAAKEKENWVYAGRTCLYPTYDRCLISLSRGGGDAAVVREFDLGTKAFVDGGFTLPEAKSDVSWKDRDTIYVATDFGPGSLTASGYPRIVKEWKRGAKLADAAMVYEAGASDIAASAGRSWDHGTARDFVHRVITTYTSEVHLRGASGELSRLEVPLDASTDVWNGHLLVTLRSDWKLPDRTWPRGALIATPLADFLGGGRAFTMLFEPAPNRSLDGVADLKSALVINELEDIKNRLYVWKPGKGTWSRQPLGGGELGSRSLWPVEAAGDSDEYWLLHTDYLTPSSLSLGKLGASPALLKRSPAFFDATGLVAAQHFATSPDGTRVPYFQVSRKALALDGKAPTVLYGYGGFEISLTPGYDPTSGAAWLERGGVYVVANIRGGGEYGPAWHQAALRHQRQRAYDDFIAVAEDLIARKVTSPAHLGAVGGSNGGLLTGVMLTQRPELFGAIVCSVPLLDMKRYHKLLAGASWMEEYGDPEKPEDWAVLATYSPYHNVRKGTRYPRTLFTSSTRDDRVHPGHARKMVARMKEQGHDILYYENIEGGHGGAADNEQHALMQALQFAFFAKQLGLR
jgi:prolyl oligopeptidase